MIDGPRLKRVAGYVVFGLVLYLVFLIATAPAFLLAEAAARLSNGTLTLAAPRGTLWGGTGELYAGVPATGIRELGTLRWQVNPLWLFIGRAQLRLELNGATQGQASMRLSRKHLNVQELSAVFPAHLVSLVYPPAAFFAPTGTIELRAPSIDLSREGLVTATEVQWQGAGGRFTGATGLGDYRIELNGRGETATIRLTTLRGNLDLNGEGQWRLTGDGDLQFTGTAAARAGATELEPLLQALGRDLGGGRREIRFNSRVPLVRQLGL
jgi:general secretion pathway protein N